MRSVLVLGIACGCAAGAPAQEWKPVPGKIMTRWAGEVDPAAPLPEYPRPLLVRAEWQNLNGLWDYAIHDGAPGPGAGYDGRILVPFPVQSALSGVGKPLSPTQVLEYHRRFRVPPGWMGGSRRIMLHFGAVDWDAQVLVNTRVVGEHKGGYTPFSADITSAVLSDGENDLVVLVRDPGDTGGQPRGKQWNQPHGIWYTPTSGIWQTVWMEPVPEVNLDRVRLIADGAGGRVTLRADDARIPPGTSLDVVVSEGGRELARGTLEGGRGAPDLSMEVPGVTRWSPEHPTLYGVELELKDEFGRVADHAASYVAFRTIEVRPDRTGVNRLMLNGEPVFMYGPLDQGFWPDGLYTAPTEDAMRFDIEAARSMGCNMLRKHVKVEPDRFYYLCDKLGMMVWQDMPSPFFHDGTGENRFHNPSLTGEWKSNFERELSEVIESRWSHPSIVMWVPFNEGWGQNDLAWAKSVVDLVRTWDPSRLVDCASGWTDTGNGSVLDIHVYPGPDAPHPKDARAAVLGEFGGLGLPVEGHTWVDRNNWGYVSYKSQAELTDAYVQRVRQLPYLIAQGLCAAVYTQTTDVEIECNGWLTYDRAVWKIDPARASEALLATKGPPPALKTLLANAGDAPGASWRWTATDPGEGWTGATFDDHAWNEGPAGFGSEGTPGAVIGTPWTGADIWLRRTATLEAGAADPAITIHHDEDAEVFVNGVPAASPRGYTTRYEVVPVSEAAARVLRAGGQLTIAVHCHQTKGGQFIDLGLVDLVAPK